MKSIFKLPGLMIFLLLMGILSSFKFLQQKTSLTTEEVNALVFMLEEEKMAFDVYSLMDEKWGTTQFGHIKQSEVMHMNAVKQVLDKNNVKYTVLETGKFNDQKLQNLFNELILQGNKSETEALKAGAKIEDVDIYDLVRLKNTVSDKDVLNAFNFLECGSRNHLRAFTRGLTARNESYVPQFLTTKEYETILNGEHERCGQQSGMGMGQGKGKGRGQGQKKGMCAQECMN